MRCPLCNKDNKNEFVVIINHKSKKAIRCDFCELVYLKDYKKDRKEIYNDDYSIWNESNKDIEKSVAESKKILFENILHKVLKFQKDTKDKKILDIGTGQGYLLDVASKYEFDCYGVEISEYASKEANKKFPNKIFNGDLKQAKYKDNFFDVITLTDVLEHINNPLDFFKEVCRITKPDGIILITTPSHDSITQKILRKNWFQYKEEHVTYWNEKSINLFFDKNNCGILLLDNNKKRLKLSYYANYFKKYKSFIGNLFLFFYKLLPKTIKDSSITNPITGELLIIGRNNEMKQ